MIRGFGEHFWEFWIRWGVTMGSENGARLLRQIFFDL